MSLDQMTLGAIDYLTQLWGVSKSEVMRRSIRQAKEAAIKQEKTPSPLEALDWLQTGGGMLREDANRLREEIAAERDAKRYWWEEP